MDRVALNLVDKTSKIIDIWLKKDTSLSSLLTCVVCHAVHHIPTTLSCGHTFCKKCIEHSQECKICKKPINWEKPSFNVSLAAILSQVHPANTQLQVMMDEAELLVKEGSYGLAIAKYDECLKIDKSSATVYRKRAKVLAKTGDNVASHLSLERAISLDKKCPEGYLDKAGVLLKLGNEEEALLQYLVAFGLDADNSDVLETIKKIVFNILSREIHQKSHEQQQRNERVETVNVYENALKFRNTDHKETITLERNQSSCTDQRPKMVISKTTLDKTLRDFEARMMQKFDEVFDFSNNVRDDGCSDFKKSSDENNIETAYFECSLCMRVFLDPVCTPCGHEFCRECLQRSMDHNCLCPLCKQKIDFNLSMNLEIDVVMQSLIEKQSSLLHFDERMMQHKKEIALFKQSLPIFVCTTAFPTVPCPLRIFEPRYRLLLRRAMDIHGNCFGITTSCTDNPFQNVGTIIRINHVHFFPDGHSVIQAIGIKRFRVVSYGSQDGYNTAQIQIIKDNPVTGKSNVGEIKALMDEVYALAKTWWTSHCKKDHHGFDSIFSSLPESDYSMGENGPNWMWFTLAASPLSDTVKLRILSQTSLKKRLQILQRILLRLTDDNHTESD